ncbi:MAG: glycosyltransferase family 2 protein [Bacilli bacterium]
MLFLSFIVPMYNSSKTIERCLFSLINQNTSIKYEIIVIDDGSNDGSDKIIEKFNGSIIYFKQNNFGPSNARYSGVKLSSSLYTAFVDSDDSVSSDYVESVYQAYLKFQFDICIIDLNIIRNGNAAVLKKSFFKNEGIINSNDYLYALAVTGDIGFSASRIYATKLLLNRYRISDLKFSEDLYLGIVMYEKTDEIYYLNKAIYNYFLFSGTLSSSINIDIVKNSLQVLECRKKILDKYSLQKNFLVYAKKTFYSLISKIIKAKKTTLGQKRQMIMSVYDSDIFVLLITKKRYLFKSLSCKQKIVVFISLFFYYF